MMKTLTYLVFSTGVTRASRLACSNRLPCHRLSYLKHHTDYRISHQLWSHARAGPSERRNWLNRRVSECEDSVSSSYNRWVRLKAYKIYLFIPAGRLLRKIVIFRLSRSRFLKSESLRRPVVVIQMANL